MKLEHFGMAEPGDCRVVFSASAAELEAAVQAEQAAPDAPADEEELLTNAVNRAILEGFSPLFAQLMDSPAGPTCTSASRLRCRTKRRCAMRWRSSVPPALLT